MKKSFRHKGAKIRMCAACGLRACKDQQDYIRVVLPKGETAVIDREGNSPGRGAYVCRSPECVRKLCKSRRLSHLLRGTVSDALYEALRQEVGLNGF